MQALGRTPEALDAFQRAITLDKRLTAAYLALGESLLFDAKYAQALERLKAAGAPLEASPAGKFALGGALIATGDAKKGLPLISAAAKERADDPRGPFWTGFAATMKQPPGWPAPVQARSTASTSEAREAPPPRPSRSAASRCAR